MRRHFSPPSNFRFGGVEMILCRPEKPGFRYFHKIFPRGSLLTLRGLKAKNPPPDNLRDKTTTNQNNACVE